MSRIVDFFVAIDIGVILYLVCISLILHRVVQSIPPKVIGWHNFLLLQIESIVGHIFVDCYCLVCSSIQFTFTRFLLFHLSHYVSWLLSLVFTSLFSNSFRTLFVPIPYMCKWIWNAQDAFSVLQANAFFFILSKLNFTYICTSARTLLRYVVHSCFPTYEFLVVFSLLPRVSQQQKVNIAEKYTETNKSTNNLSL